MKQRVVVAELIEIANILDKKDMPNEADKVTKIAQDLSSAPLFEETPGYDRTIEGPDDYRADQLDAGAEQYESEEAIKTELARAEAIDRLNEIQKMEMPTDEDIAEAQRLLEFLETTDKPQVDQFTAALQEGGANVVDPNDPFANE